MQPLATDSPFSEAEARTIVALAEGIIPASPKHGVPSAGDPTIAADILATAKRYPAQVAAALALEDRLAIAKFGQAFADLDVAARLELVAGASRPGFFDDVAWEFDPEVIAGQRTLLSIIVQCYYRDDRVMRSLDMEPRSPYPQGFSVEEGDWSLLDPVRRRGKLYREVGTAGTTPPEDP